MVSNHPISAIFKGVALGVLLMLAWFIGFQPMTPIASDTRVTVAEKILTIDGTCHSQLPTVPTGTFSIGLGKQQDQIGFLPYQDKVPPGWAQGGLPTEFYRDNQQMVWIGDPYGPRLTGWSPDGKFVSSYDLPFLRNDATQEKEIVGFTIKPAQNNGWFVLNNQNKKMYRLDQEGNIVHILSIPLILSDSRILLTISPFFEVFQDQWIFVTLESTDQPYTPRLGFAGGTFLDTRWESYFISVTGEVVGPLPESTSVIAFEEGILLWSYEPGELKLQWVPDPHSLTSPQKTWLVKNPLWHYGGLIGTDLENNIYFWADRSVIGRLQTNTQAIHYAVLPVRNAFPVTITPDGEIGYILANRQNLQVHFVKFMD